jgi:hypothetical protein
VIFPGPDSGERVWTDKDWENFHQRRAELFMRDLGGRESLSDFADQIQRLSEWYSPGEEEQFVWAIALLYAGVPYGSTRLDIIGQGFGGPRIQVPQCAGKGPVCAWLGHGMRGFSPEVATEAENTHHYFDNGTFPNNSLRVGTGTLTDQT